MRQLTSYRTIAAFARTTCLNTKVFYMRWLFSQQKCRFIVCVDWFWIRLYTKRARGTPETDRRRMGERKSHNSMRAMVAAVRLAGKLVLSSNQLCVGRPADNARNKDRAFTGDGGPDRLAEPQPITCMSGLALLSECVLIAISQLWRQRPRKLRS